MIIGQATLGIEIFEQMMEFDVIILPTIMDGCGVTVGIAIAIRESNPNIKIIVSEHTYTQTHTRARARALARTHARTQMIFGNRKLFMLIINVNN